jgi:hypothetical protein
MNERELHHMYQAWLQGNENYVRDWAKFVEWAAQWHKTTGDEVMRVLQKTYWFKWGDQ